MNPVGVLLAAGGASRFGAAKLLHPLADGTPIGKASARVLSETLSRVVAVVRPGDGELQQLFSDMGLELVEHSRPENGLGSSLAAGVKAAPDASAWLIALADMPWVKPATVTTLAQHLQRGASIVAPVHRGQRGHPVGFSARWFSELIDLGGDRGARDLLVQHSAQLIKVDTQDAGILLDVDYPADLPG